MLDRSHLLFIDAGVKIIGAYYCDVLLAQHLLPDIRNLALEGYSIFQQDSVPVSRNRLPPELAYPGILYFYPSVVQ